jgi:hypothetical protein
MRLLHKLNGLQFLNSNYSGQSKKERNWFKGYHVYRSQDEVVKRFQGGRPISCFSLNDSGNDVVHVAFKNKGKRRSDGTIKSATISYLTLHLDCSSVAAEESGVHFCSFSLKKDTNGSIQSNKVDPKEFEPKIAGYSMMLPYITDIGDDGSYNKNGFSGKFLYTLVYSDWEVLQCTNNDGVRKGRVAVEQGVFSEILELETS